MPYVRHPLQMRQVAMITLTTPVRDASYGDTASYAQEGQDDATQLAYRSRRQTWLEVVERC